MGNGTEVLKQLEWLRLASKVFPQETKMQASGLMIKRRKIREIELLSVDLSLLVNPVLARGKVLF